MNGCVCFGSGSGIWKRDRNPGEEKGGCIGVSTVERDRKRQKKQKGGGRRKREKEREGHSAD